MQDQPLLTLTAENYPSLEFIQEVPARGAPRRLEFCEETRNGGTARRIYRPMMCAADLIAFLETDFANRGAAIWSAADAAAPSAQTGSSALGGEAEPAHPAPALGPAQLRSAGAARVAPAPNPVAAGGGQSAQLRSARKRLSELHERVRAFTQARAGEFDSAKRRRLLLHETQFLVRNALVDAFATLLEGLEELDSQERPC